MEKIGFFPKVKDFFLRFSYGLIFVLALGWVYLRVENLFPVFTTGWKDYIQTSIIFIFLLLGIGGLMGTSISKVFKESFLKGVLKFVISAVISGLFFYGLSFLINVVIKGQALPTIREGLVGIAPGIIILYIFLVSNPEELIFRVKIPDEIEARYQNYSPRARRVLKYCLSTLFFALYHAALGRSMLTLLIYVPLGFLFMWLREKYSVFSAMGVHFSYDIFILGFMS